MHMDYRQDEKKGINQMTKNVIILYLDEMQEVSFIKKDTTYYRSIVEQISGVFDGMTTHEAITKLYIDYLIEQKESIDQIYVLTTINGDEVFKKFKVMIQKFISFREYKINLNIERISLEYRKNDQVFKYSIHNLYKQIQQELQGANLYLDFSGERIPYQYLLLNSILVKQGNIVKEIMVDDQDEYGQILKLVTTDTVQYNKHELVDILDYEVVQQIQQTMDQYEVVYDEKLNEQALRYLKAILYHQDQDASEAFHELLHQLQSYLPTLERFAKQEPKLQSLYQNAKMLLRYHSDGGYRQHFQLEVLAFFIQRELIQEVRKYYKAVIDPYLLGSIFHVTALKDEPSEQLESLLFSNYEPRIFIGFLQEFGQFIDVGSMESIDLRYMASKYSDYLKSKGLSIEKVNSTIRKFAVVRSYFIGKDYTSNSDEKSEQVFASLKAILKQHHYEEDWKILYKEVLLQDVDYAMAIVLEVDISNNRFHQTLEYWDTYLKGFKIDDIDTVKKILIDRLIVEMRNDPRKKIELPMTNLKQLGYTMEILQNLDDVDTNIAFFIDVYKHLKRWNDQQKQQ